MKEIDQKIYSLLSADTALQTLLGGTAANRKIYPDMVNAVENIPCVVYTETDSVGNTVPQNTQVGSYEIRTMAKDTSTVNGKALVVDITEAVKDVLDQYDEPGTEIYFKFKKTLETDAPFEDRNLQGKLLRYEITTRIL